MSEPREWACVQCPAQEEGGLHNPRGLYLLRQVSPQQSEVEIVVSCTHCGQFGLATLPLEYSSVWESSPTAPVGELVDLVRWTAKFPAPYESGDLKARIQALRAQANDLEMLMSDLKQGCCGRKTFRGRSEKCSDCPR